MNYANRMMYSLFIGFWFINSYAQTDNPRWLTIQQPDLSIQASSALDFSELVETGIAGQHGRIIANAQGHLAYTNQPAKTQRFFCVSQAYGRHYPAHEIADRYARQIRLHGYNLVRFHFVEDELMRKQTQDFVLNPEAFDRFHYFLAALKREGIYWLMDGMTSWNGLYGDEPQRWLFTHNLKLDVYSDAQAQAHWRKSIDLILNTENPYTKLTPLQDPALLGVILVNEGSLNHLTNLSSTKLSELQKFDKTFESWLIAKYGSLDKTFATWGEARDKEGLLIARNNHNASLRVADTQEFFYHSQLKLSQWMTNYLRSLGYQGLITAYDNWYSLQDNASRQPLAWIDMHSYQDEPSTWVNKPGSSLKQQSSFDDNLRYVRDLASTRYWFKPFTVSEYDHPFWDGFRYETGLAVGAYASFQDWDMICRHSHGVELSYATQDEASKVREAVYPFDVGTDPIARASETLAALLFARGDVKTAQHKITVHLTPDYAFKQQAGIHQLPSELSQIALVTGLGLSWQQELSKTDKLIQPNQEAPSIWQKAINKLRKWSGISNPRWLKLYQELKQDGILAKENQTDGSSQFQSDTNEITLNTESKTLKVITAKTEAVAFTKTPPPLAMLTVQESSEPALLAASALDNSPLQNSKRILLIYATDAQNSGMEFTDSSRKTLKQLGKFPVQIKNSKIRFNLKNTHSKNLHLYALYLNGQRSIELPLDKAANDSLNITLDLNTLADKPTTYFELITD